MPEGIFYAGRSFTRYRLAGASNRLETVRQNPLLRTRARVLLDKAASDLRAAQRNAGDSHRSTDKKRLTAARAQIRRASGRVRKAQTIQAKADPRGLDAHLTRELEGADANTLRNIAKQLQT